jgi:hypothetical protein
LRFQVIDADTKIPLSGVIVQQHNIPNLLLIPELAPPNREFHLVYPMSRSDGYVKTRPIDWYHYESDFTFTRTGYEDGHAGITGGGRPEFYVTVRVSDKLYSFDFIDHFFDRVITIPLYQPIQRGRESFTARNPSKIPDPFDSSKKRILKMDRLITSTPSALGILGALVLASLTAIGSIRWLLLPRYGFSFSVMLSFLVFGAFFLIFSMILNINQYIFDGSEHLIIVNNYWFRSLSLSRTTYRFDDVKSIRVRTNELCKKIAKIMGKSENTPGIWE